MKFPSYIIQEEPDPFNTRYRRSGMAPKCAGLTRRAWGVMRRKLLSHELSGVFCAGGRRRVVASI